MNGMTILITTFNRVNNQRTFEDMPESVKSETIFVAYEEEVPLLKERYGNTGAQFVVPDIPEKGLALKRKWILENATSEKILILDDDLRFLIRDNPESNYLRRATDEEIEQKLYEFSEHLDNYAHVGASPRQGNNRFEQPYVLNNRVLCGLGFRPEIVREHCELGRIKYRSDFDYTLQLLSAGYENLIMTDFALDHDFNNKGGLNGVRKLEEINQTALQLAEFHPGLVRVVEKQFKGGPDRLEVVCQWKKAYKNAPVKRTVSRSS